MTKSKQGDETNVVYVKPFLKWIGGKTALLPEILPRLPAKIGTYYEPFVGGGAVFFALATGRWFERAVLSDLNEELMNVYAVVCGSPDELLLCLDYDIGQDEKTYYEIRALNPKTLSPAMRAARTIYLNKVGFNGLYRVNRKGQFNVPWGRQEGRSLFDEPNLLKCSLLLQQTNLCSVDFVQATIPAKRGDAVYFDPPYVPVSTTSSFVGYAKGGFGEEDQTRLRDVAKKLVDRGVHVLLSNSDTPVVRKLYKGFRIEEVQAPRRVNSKGDKRGNVKELLISGRHT